MSETQDLDTQALTKKQGRLTVLLFAVGILVVLNAFLAATEDLGEVAGDMSVGLCMVAWLITYIEHRVLSVQIGHRRS